jgi:hypothetical protein
LNASLGIHPLGVDRELREARLRATILAMATPKMEWRVRAAAVLKSQPLRLAGVNQTDTNLSDLRCEVGVDGPVLSFFDTQDAEGSGASHHWLKGRVKQSLRWSSARRHGE